MQKEGVIMSFLSRFNRSRYHPLPPSQELRQIRRSRWHGAVLIAWGLWGLILGGDIFTTPAYAAFALFPAWIWQAGAIIAGLTAILYSSNPPAMNRDIPGRIVFFAWFVLTCCYLIGNYRLPSIPIYAGMAFNAYFFLVRE
jgi:hypothetical protein